MNSLRTKIGLALAALFVLHSLSALFVLRTLSAHSTNSYLSKRPPLSERKFTSEAVEKEIARIASQITDPKLAWMFTNCYPNTLDTTVEFETIGGRPYTFVVTGDINAMWLRDSSAQLYPYLALANKDKKLQALIAGTVNKQTELLLRDPYANAFMYDTLAASRWKDDGTEMKPGVYERKWELDSPCYAIRLAYYYWKITGDSSIFDHRWVEAMQGVYNTFRRQQRKEDWGGYTFLRVTDRQGDTQLYQGKGSPVNPVGLIASAFRPSDDATIFGFLIPSNMFAVVSLRQLAEILSEVKNEPLLSKQCLALADEVDRAIKEYGVVRHPQAGSIFAFEVDGFGNALMMDDANVPGLLSIPYLGYTNAENPTYKNTRKFVWSRHNPYFYKGKAGEGISGPHIGFQHIWPMSIIMKAMTSTDKAEISACLKQLVNTDAGTGFIHESFHKDNAAEYTRDWMAWANTLFGELIVKLSNEHPELLKAQYNTGSATEFL